jgi:hypothetical protein
MGLFDQVSTSKTVKAEKDVVRGQKKEPLASDIYNMIIKYAYATKSKGGALGITIVMATSEGREIKDVQYITSGDAKGNKTYYEKQNADTKVMEQFSLPGFNAIDSLCRLLLDKSVLECDNEKRTIKLYDFTAKAEVATEVDMLIDLVGKPVSVAVLNQIEDKTAKNAQTGNYEATGKTYSTNVVDKYLDPNDRCTAQEKANKVAPTFADSWLAKWKGQVSDQSTTSKTAGQPGAPAATGEVAPKTSLFG